MKTQDGIVVGNVEDKSELSNPIAAWLVHRFDRALLDLLARAAPRSLHEVGCGEARLTRMIARRHPVPIRATDLGTEIIAANRELELPGVTFACASIYDLAAPRDAADVVVCCEVLEHLSEPDAALEVLKGLGARRYLLSVPREPLWRILNLCRGKYVTALGNTPGHVQHWSRGGFRRLLARHGFRALAWRTPLPWTMVCGRFEAPGPGPRSGSGEPGDDP